MAKMYKSQYSKNIKYSTKNILGDLMKDLMPTLSTTATTNKDASDFLRKMNAGTKSPLKQYIRNTRRSIFGSVGETISNLKADIKSGELYNETRLAGNQDTAMDSLLSWDSDSSDNLALQNAMSTSTFGPSREATMISSATAESSEYLGEVINANNAQTMLMTTKFHLSEMKALTNMQKINTKILEFNTTVLADHIEQSHKFYNDVLENLSATNQLLIKQVQSMNARYGVEGQTSRANELADIVNMNGSFNIGEYKKLIKRNINKKTGFYKDLVSMGWSSVKGSPVSTIISLLGSFLIPEKVKDKFGNMDKAISGLFASYLMNMSKMSRTGKSSLSRLLGSILGTNLTTDMKPDLSVYQNKELTVQLEQRKAKAITEVIPSYLNELLKAFTGKDKIYDYKTGKFVDKSKKKAEVLEDRKYAVYSAMSSTRAEMHTSLNKISNNFDADTNGVLREDLDAFIHFIGTLGEEFKLSSAMSDYKKYVRMGLNLRGGAKSYKIIIGIYKSLSHSQRSAVRNEQLQSVIGMREMRQRLDDYLQTSGASAAFNDIDDTGDEVYTTISRNARRKAGKGGGAFNASYTAEEVADMLKKSNKSSKDARKEYEDILKAEKKARGIKDDTDEDMDALGKKVTAKLKKMFSKVTDKIDGATSFVGKVVKSTSKALYSILYGDSTSGKGIIGQVFELASKKIGQGISSLNKKIFSGTDKDGKEYTGFFSKEASSFIKKYFPKAIKGAGVGALIGLITKHPIAGALAGAAVNILAGTSKIHDILWGDPKVKNDKGLLGGVRDDIRSFMKKNVGTPLKSWLSKNINKFGDFIIRKAGIGDDVKKYAYESVRGMEHGAAKNAAYKKNRHGINGLFTYLGGKAKGFFRSTVNSDKEFDKAEASEEAEAEDIAREAETPSANATVRSVRVNSDISRHILRRLNKPIPVYIVEGRSSTVTSTTGPVSPDDDILKRVRERNSKIGIQFFGQKKSSSSAETKKVEEEISTFTKIKNKLGKFGNKAKGIGAGAIASSLLGLGPVPGAIVGAIFSRSKKKKSDSTGTAKSSDETSDKDIKEGEKKISMFSKLKGLGLGAAASSLLGLGPIPGILVASIFNNLKKKKSSKKKDKENMSEEELAKQIDPKTGTFFQKARNVGIGTLIGSMFGMPWLGAAGGLIFNRFKYKKKSGANADDVKDYGKPSNTKSGMQAKKSKSFLNDLLNLNKHGDQAKAAEKVAQKLKNADSPEEIATLVDATTVANNVEQTKSAAGIVTKSKNAVDSDSGFGSMIKEWILAKLGIKVGGKFLSGGLKSVLSKVGGAAVTAYGVGAVAKGVSNVTSGISDTAGGDGSADSISGSGKIVRGTVQTGTGVSILVSKLASFIEKVATKTGKKAVSGKGASIATKIASKFSAKLAPKAAAIVAKWASGIGIALIIAQAVTDFTTGMAETRNILQTTATYEPTTSMKITCGLSKMISNLLLGIIPASSIASVIYNIIGKDADKEELRNQQQKAKSDYEDFIKANPEAAANGLTYEKYQQLTNKTVWGKITGKSKSIYDYAGGIEKANMTYDASTVNNIIVAENNAKTASGGRGIFEDIKNWVTGKKTKNAKLYKTSNAKTFRTFLNSLFGSGARGTDPDYYNQKDSRWGNTSYGKYNGSTDTIGKGGCGPTTAAMMIQKLTGLTLTPDEVAELALRYDLKSSDGGTTTRLFDVLGSKYGIRFNTQNGLSDTAIQALRMGIPVAMMGKGSSSSSPFGNGTHYVLGTGLDKNGSVNILDPLNKNNNKSFSQDVINKGIMKSIIPSNAGRGSTPVADTSFVTDTVNTKRNNALNKEVKRAMETSNSGATSANNAGVETAMLSVLNTIAETLLRIETTNAVIAKKPAGTTIVNGGSNSTGVTQNTSAKEPLYNSIISGI